MQIAYKVYLRGKHRDTVFYSAEHNMTSAEVRSDLIDHDGYNPNIIVKKQKAKS